MACFLVPAAEALVTTVAAKAVQTKTAEPAETANKAKIPFFKKLKWLSNLLWGGSVLLAFEHVWHGEVVPWFPFLTAASNPGDTAEMLHEISTTGVAMALLITAVWVGMVLASTGISKKAVPPVPAVTKRGI